MDRYYVALVIGKNGLVAADAYETTGRAQVKTTVFIPVSVKSFSELVNFIISGFDDFAKVRCEVLGLGPAGGNRLLKFPLPIINALINSQLFFHR